MTANESALALNANPVAIAARPSADAFEPNSMPEAMSMAEVLAKSGLVPKALASKEAVFYVLVAGRELGFSAVQSLRSLHIIDGKIVMSADLMVSQALRSGLAEYFLLLESTDKLATYETKRRNAPAPTKMSFTLEQAQRAGLLGKQNWKNHPEAMLRARCASALARAVYPDAVQGMYDPDEAEEFRRASAPQSSVARAQTAPVAGAGVPPATEVPAVSSGWAEKIKRATTQAKPIRAMVLVARQIADKCPDGELAVVSGWWSDTFSQVIERIVVDDESLGGVRGVLLESDFGSNELKQLAYEVLEKRAAELGNAADDAPGVGEEGAST